MWDKFLIHFPVKGTEKASPTPVAQHTDPIWVSWGGSCSHLPLLRCVLPLRLDFNGFYTERLEHMSAERSQKAPPLLPRLAVPAQ